MNFGKYFSITIVIFAIFLGRANGAIQFGSSTAQAPFAASSTKQVGSIIGDVVSGDIKNGSSTLDSVGIFQSVAGFFISVNTWMHDKAGIDFFGILKGIGHFFILVVQFVFDLLKKVL